MTEQPAGPHCGNNPNAQLTDGDRKAVDDFKARLALQASAKPYIDSAVWVDGDPLMEVIAVTVYERCETGDGGIVHDDPRTIAAFAAAVARAHAAAPYAPADRAVLRDDLEEALKGAGVYDDKERMWRSLSPAWIEEILTEVLAVLPEPADRAAVLSDTERQFLTYALDQAAEEMSLGDRCTDEDQAALDRLRRIAVEAQHPACPGYETAPPPNRCTCDCEGCKHHCAAHQAVEAQQPEPAAVGSAVAGHTGDETGEVTPADLAHALDNATPYPIELDRALCDFMAARLLEMLTVRKRPEHAVWQPEDEPEPGEQPQPQDPDAAGLPAGGTPHTKEADDPRSVCVCGHTRAEHLTVSGRLLCDACDPDSTSNLVCRGFDAL